MITWLLWTLILSLQQSHALTVTVLDAEARPVEGAVIARADRFVFARSGPDGTAELFLPADAPILFEVDAAGYQPATRRLEPPLPTRVSVRLSDAARLVGRLVDEHFEALPGTVQLDFGTSKRIATVDEDGRFDLEIEPDEAGELALASPAALPSRFPVEPLGHGEIRDLGEIVLEPGLVVTGGVVSPDGTPAEGAEAWVLRRGGDGPILAWLRDDRARAITDESGRFRLSGIAAEPARVVIEAANAARHEVMIRPEPEEESLDLGWIRLETGVEVRVEVSPEEEGMVRLDLGGQARPSDVLDAPPEDGVATFHNVPTGQVAVSVTHVSAAHGPQLDCRRRVTIPAEVEIFEPSADPSGCSWPDALASGIDRPRAGSSGGPWTIPSPKAAT